MAKRFSQSGTTRRQVTVEKSPATGRRIWSDTADAWKVPPAPHTESWVPEHVRVPDELITDTDAFDCDDFPHVVDVLRAADDPTVREIYLRWSTRNAKTFTTLSILMALVEATGRPAMFASSNEDRIDDAINSELYPMLEACQPTRSKLLPIHKRSAKKGVVIGKGRIRRCFQGSASTLAGFQAVYGLANEVGLWSKNMINRFRQRARLFPFDSVLMYEGKPEAEGECAISDLCEKETTQRRFRHVPCPHCGLFQRLRWPNVKWDKPDGAKHSDAKVARDTAHYECENGCRIENSDRPGMMRAGVWLAEGLTIDNDGTIHGEPLVISANVAFDGLSALYSLKIAGWGTLVSEYLDAKNDPESLREFVTGTLAEQWRVKPKSVEPNVVATRLRSEEPADVCPLWARFLIRAVDVQTPETGYEFPWGVVAFGPFGRSQLISYGIAYEWDAVRELIKWQKFAHADGGPPMVPAWTAVDSGKATTEVYDFCRPIARCLPVKGMKLDAALTHRLTPIDEHHKEERIRSNPRKAVINGETMLLGVNSDRSQEWIQNAVTGITKDDDPARFTVSADGSLDENMIAELLNETKTKSFDQRGFPVFKWTRIDENAPNDTRDIVRYCWALGMFVTNHGRDYDKLPERTGSGSASVSKPRKRSENPITSGAGRQWPKTNR